MTEREAIVQRLKQANELVAELPEHLQAEAFCLAFKELGSPAAVAAPTGDVSTQPKNVEKATKAADEGAITQDVFFAELSQASNVDEATLREIYYWDAGKVGLNLRGQDLGDSKKARMVSISTLLAGAYRLGLESELPVSHAQAVAETLHSLDASNFAKHIRSNPNVTYTGPKRRKVLDLRAGREENYKELVESLVD